MANEEISVDSMRLLFSLLDTDGGGSLSSEEIKRGMLLLGFHEADDPVALGRLIQSIDQDQTGSISESEFLAFMSKESRNSLTERMSKWSLKYTHMQATRYPSIGELSLEMAELSCEASVSLIREALKSDASYNYWIEMVGYDTATFSALAEALGVSHDALADALLFSDPACRRIDAAAPAAAIILHHARMSVDPVRPRPHPSIPAPLAALIDAVFGGDSVNIKPPELLRGCHLAHKGAICDANVTREQAAILVVADRLVVTLRLPGLDFTAPPHHADPKVAAAHTTPEIRWAQLSAAARPGGPRPFAWDSSSVRAAFERLRYSLPTLVQHTLAASGAAAPARHGAKLLAVLLVDCVAGGLRELRNRMQDWDELLDASIRGKQCSANTIHLEAMASVAGHFKAVLEPLAGALDPDRWADCCGDGAGPRTAAAQYSSDAVVRLVSPLSPGSPSPRDTPRDGGGRGAGGPAGPGPLGEFFRGELTYFKELAGDVGVRSGGARVGSMMLRALACR